MRVRELKAELWVPRDIAEVFSFFADAHNLDALTPAWLKFEIVTPGPIEMRRGTLLDYRLRIRGLPVRWRTLISHWDPPHRFVDEQIRGPYRQWIHEHTFEAHDRGTLVRDKVRYAVPFDFLVHRWFVRPDVERIFRFRTEALQKRFAPGAKNR